MSQSDLLIEHELLDTGKAMPDGVGKQPVEIEGVMVSETWNKEKSVKITSVKIMTQKAAERMGRKCGNYITLEIKKLSAEEEKIREGVIECLKQELICLEKGKKTEHILVIGLGNREVTADAIGPFALENVFVTRHMMEYERIKQSYKTVSAFVPGVMAQTGMETMELIQGVNEKIRPDLVIVIDALAAKNAGRLCTTIQLTDTGIRPGAGVGNHRKELNRESLGTDVIAIGVPTVLNAEEIAEPEQKEEVKELLVMPRNIDSSVRYISKLLAEGINLANRREEH